MLHIELSLLCAWIAHSTSDVPRVSYYCCLLAHCLCRHSAPAICYCKPELIDGIAGRWANDRNGSATLDNQFLGTRGKPGYCSVLYTIMAVRAHRGASPKARPPLLLLAVSTLVYHFLCLMSPLGLSPISLYLLTIFVLLFLLSCFAFLATQSDPVSNCDREILVWSEGAREDRSYAIHVLHPADDASLVER